MWQLCQWKEQNCDYSTLRLTTLALERLLCISRLTLICLQQLHRSVGTRTPSTVWLWIRWAQSLYPAPQKRFGLQSVAHIQINRTKALQLSRRHLHLVISVKNKAETWWTIKHNLEYQILIPFFVLLWHVYTWICIMMKCQQRVQIFSC